MGRLGVLDAIELAAERDSLTEQIAAQRQELAADKQRVELELSVLKERLVAEKSRLGVELDQLSHQIVLTQDVEILQEVGIYNYRHPLQDSVAYKDELARLQGQVKAMAKREGGAIETAAGWTVNGSAAQGRAMLRDYAKLMLRAYNAEADNMVRSLKPYKLDAAGDRLNKVVTTIERLEKTMSIRVAPAYHALRIKELELTADYQEMLAREKDKEREERERLREERKAQQELERERDRLAKERQHYSNALQALLDNGDHEAAARLQAQLDDVDRAIKDVDYRAANIRAGYVYVISNLGSFGERMIKVGLTRRLEPLDRIRELSDASVPFNFDIHALFFSNDAVDIETKMHQRLADRRVNKVNARREFFYATPAEARDHLAALTGDLLTFEEQPEAAEYRQSNHDAPQTDHDPHSPAIAPQNGSR